MNQRTAESGISVRPLLEAELDAADRIMRLAFGTFFALPDPISFVGDAAYVRPRWRADPTAAFAAHLGAELVGSNFVTNWGSVGFLGPLTVRPDLWDRGIGKRLMEPALERFAAWGTRHACLFTFAQSQKHVGLYQKFGFWPRFLTAVMSKPVVEPKTSPRWSHYSELPEHERAVSLGMCRELTEAVHEGLDLRREIASVQALALGDTVLLREDGALAGFAICHHGAGTEAGSGACYVKFGTVRPGLGASERFQRLLEACEALAARQGAARLVAGVNTSRHDAYRQMMSRGFRTDLQGIAMQEGNEPGYNRADVFVIDDWR